MLYSSSSSAIDNHIKCDLQFDIYINISIITWSIQLAHWNKFYPEYHHSEIMKNRFNKFYLSKNICNYIFIIFPIVLSSGKRFLSLRANSPIDSPFYGSWGKRLSLLSIKDKHHAKIYYCCCLLNLNHNDYGDKIETIGSKRTAKETKKKKSMIKDKEEILLLCTNCKLIIINCRKSIVNVNYGVKIIFNS